MNSTFLSRSLITSSLALVLTGTMTGQEVQDVRSAAEVSQKRRSSAAHVYQNAGAKIVEETVQSVERPSLLDKLEFLIGVHGFTFIPKGSVVAKGSGIEVTSVPPKSGKYLTWTDFYSKHRASLRFLKISEQQWGGKSSLKPLLASIEAAQTSGVTTLTALNGQPINFPPLLALSQETQN